MGVDDMMIRCPDCRGAGTLGIDDKGRKIDCKRCGNTGKAKAKKCKHCEGHPYEECSECGTRFLACPWCNGLGIVPK